MNAWVLDKDKPLSQVLLGQGALSEGHLGVLDALVQAHLERHGGDPARSLASVSTGGDVRGSLGQVTDAEVQASLSNLPATRGDPGLTGPYAPAGPESRYRVLRPHAKGGLGQVSVAFDEELHREVALKEIQERHAGHPESRARFLLEAGVTGGLEHPGVVPVYGLGAHPDGRPFYAMRLIKGDSLKEAIDRFEREKVSLPAGERALRLRQMLGRFVAVCQAVAYAHSRGVLHRDLKPANVMVGPYGETLVVDWGLAKVLGRAEAEGAEGVLRPTLSDDPAATQPGAALGTPAYMPPEQAAGRLDQLGPRSDVYSLGATLYTVLTGRPPLTDPDTGEVLRRVQRGDFPRPREVAPDVPAALEAVCRKAMALRPEGRYGSPQELAGDVERWLADEPVGAHREPLPARLARWARRHRASVLAAAAALAVLAVSLGVLAAVLTGHNRALAEANGREREAKEKARGNFQLARQAVKDYCVAVALEPRLKQADLSGLRKDLLETAARFHERFKGQEGDDPEVRAERAYAYFELGSIASATGATEEALGHFREALALWVPLVETHPDNRQYRWGLAAAYNDVSALYEAVGRFGEAEGADRKSLALRQGLADSAPGDEAAQADLAMSHSNLAFSLARRRQFPEAEEHYGSALSIYQRLADANPDNAHYQRSLADDRNKLSDLHSKTGRRDLALEGLRQALAVRQRLNREHPNNVRYQVDLGRSHVGLGWWYRDAGEGGKAEASFRQAVAAFQAAADARPGAPDYQMYLLRALSGLGACCLANGKPQEALQTQRRAVEAGERLARLYPKDLRYAADLGGLYCNLGSRLKGSGEPQAALEWYDKAQAVLEGVRRRDPENPEGQRFLRNTHWNRADALLELGRDAEALSEWGRALTFASPAKERDSLQLGQALALARLGRYQQAVAPAERLAGRPDANSFDTYRAVRVLSLASGTAGGDARRSEAERQQLAEKYAAGAVALLRRLQTRGYFKDRGNVIYLEKDKDLGPLRQRPDFQKLLGELGKKS